jgi:nucleoid-associated protein YgaU
MAREENRTEDHHQEQHDEPAPAASHLGKEAKIGVTVILLLLVVFGVVLVMRLTRSNPDGQQLASAAPAQIDKGRSAHSTKDDLFKNFKSGPSAGGNRPTVVTATAGASQPPKTFDSDWKHASNKPVGPADDLSPKRSSPKPDMSLPPLTLPPPSKPSSGSRYDDLASAPPPPRQELGRPKPLREAAGEVPLVSPGEEKPPRPLKRDPGGLAPKRGPGDLGETPQPPRRDREKSRHDSPATPAPPPELPPLPPDASYAEASGPSRPVTPVSRNSDADDRPRHREYRRSDNDLGESSAGSADEAAPPRRSAPPSYSSPPPRRDDGKYEVQPTDSYWTISEKVYGTTVYFKALVEHNRRTLGDDERLRPGDLVSTPPAAELEKEYPDLCPQPSRRETRENRTMAVSTRQSYRSGRTYTVSEGDSLFNIARYELGKASRWVEIYDLNREVLGKDFNYLTPGMKLTLPDGDRPERVAEPPSRGYRK